MLTRIRLALLLLILLAFALRVYQLDTQSIWYDEGLSIQIAAQDPAQTIALSATTDHPPLHALLLGAWMRVAGQSDFVVRYLSVFYGVLVVALTYALGKMYDERAGLIAAGLIAIAPFAVYYSQETRGYMLLTALILIATLTTLRLLQGDLRKRVWFAYIASMALALYTHYFAAFAWVAVNVGFAVSLIVHTRPRAHVRLRLLAFWLIAQLIVLACFLPWIPNALAQAGSNATYFPGRVTWQTVFGDTWRAFSVGEWGDGSLIGWLWLALILFGGVAGLIVNIGDKAKQPSAEQPLTKVVEGTSKEPDRGIRALRVSVVILSMTLVIVPLVLMSGLAWLKPKFAPRYLLPSLPAFITLAAIGTTVLIDGARSPNRRWALMGLIVIVVLLLASAGSLARLYGDPAVARPDVRSVVQYITSHEQPSDAIILLGGHQAPAFNHYYHGQASVIPLPPDLLPAAQSPLDARVLAQLAEIARQHPRVWLVLWQDTISDPTHVIVNALMEQGRRLNVGQNFHDMGLLLFDVRDAVFEAAPQYPIDTTFIEPIRVVGYNVDSLRIPIDRPLRFGLYLQSEGSISGNYQIYTHLIAPDGRLIAQADHIAGADSYPTSLWQPGSLLYNRFEIKVPAGTAPGQYRIAVGLYDDRGRLQLADGRDQIDLFEVTIIP